jgi:hypothetical protein
MGLFDFTKKGKKTSQKAPKQKEEQFEIGPAGLMFNAKIQILASPKEYAKKIADEYVEAIKLSKDQKNNTNYHVLNVTISKPEKMKDEEKTNAQEKGVDLYKVFIETDIGVKDKSKIFDFCFDFMPFSIEVVDPMTIGFNASDLTEYVTNILATLHKIDGDLKKTIATNTLLNKQNQNLVKNMVRMLRNNVLLSLREKSKTIKELVQNIGIEEEQLQAFLDNMVSDKEIELKKGKYQVKK